MTTPGTYRKIDVNGNMRYEEAPAGVNLYPGHLLQINTDFAAYPHATLGQRALPRVALENSLFGPGTTLTQYLLSNGNGVPDTVRMCLPESGDTVVLRVAAGNKVSARDQLVSNGDGSVISAPHGTGLLFSNIADSTTITNTTTPTAFSVAYTIPANFLRVGDVFHVVAEVAVPNQNSTDTLTLALRIGGQTIVATAAVDVATNDVGFLEADFTVRSIGATGSVFATAEESLGVPGTATQRNAGLLISTLDTTVTEAIDVLATWSAASTSDQAVLKSLVVTLERPQMFALFEAKEDADNTSGSSDLLFKAICI